MPFEELETITKHNQPLRASISYMRQVRKDKEHLRGQIKPKLIITVPTAIFISRAERFKLLLGTGEDSNKIRLRAVPGKDPKVGLKPSEFKSYLIFRCGYVPAFGDEIFDNVECQIKRVSDDEYELDVPVDLKDAAVALLRKKVKAA